MDPSNGTIAPTDTDTIPFTTRTEIVNTPSSSADDCDVRKALVTLLKVRGQLNHMADTVMGLKKKKKEKTREIEACHRLANPWNQVCSGHRNPLASFPCHVEHRDHPRHNVRWIRMLVMMEDKAVAMLKKPHRANQHRDRNADPWLLQCLAAPLGCFHLTHRITPLPLPASGQTGPDTMRPFRWARHHTSAHLPLSDWLFRMP
ncbi:hypothetical protein TSMEX_010847 [Taenia solium]|eukprot:TsM_000187200 transcript=TsM_000187200 gene=TsM_000187200